MTQVVVVGGGIAGLLTAVRLSERGHSVTLLEAQPQLGGMITSITVGDALVDAGAEAYAVRGGTARALCDELGLAVAPPRGTSQLWWQHGSNPMATGVLGIPSSLDDPALGALSSDEYHLAATEPQLDRAVGADSTTLAELVRLRLGEAVLTKLVAPVTRGVYALSPEQMPLAEFAPQLLPKLAESGSLIAAVAQLRGPGSAAVEQPVGGMFRLIEALRERFIAAGGTLHTNAAATRLERGASGITVCAADDLRFNADQLVLATAAQPAARLLATLGVELTPPPVRTIRSVILTTKKPEFAAHPIGSGAVVAEPDGVGAKAITHYSAKWSWAPEHVFRMTYPSHARPTLEGAVGDLARLTGVPITAADITGFASLAWESVPTRISPAERTAIREQASAAGVALVGAWLDGNGIAPAIAGVAQLLEHDWVNSAPASAGDMTHTGSDS